MDRSLAGPESGSVDAGIAAETAIFLGEVHYMLGDPLSATRRFEELLREAPDTPIGVLEHDPDVVALFEAIRREIRSRPIVVVPVDPEPPISRLPASGYMPFGVPQMRQGRTGSGVLFATLQALTLGTSIGTFALLAARDDLSVGARNRVRFGVQWPTTAAFYGLWIASHVDARRRHRTVDPGIAVDARRRALRLTLSGSF